MTATPKREKPIRYAVYCRTSSEQQDVENSIAGQKSAAQEYVARNGGIIVQYYVDEAKSGRVDRRGAFQEMVEVATSDNPHFDAVLVWKLNRFARNVRDMIRYWDLLEDHDKQVVSMMEPFLEGHLGRLMRNIIASFDEFFSENMADDIKRGMKESVERGFYLAPRPPLGYRIVKVPDGGADDSDRARMRPKLELDPDYEKLARYIFDLALGDSSILDIVRQLDAEGHLNKNGKKFTRANVHDLLRNRTLTGYVVWNVDKETGEPGAMSRGQAHPAIVSPEEYEKVQQKLKSRAPNVVHPRTAASEHAFNDMGKCAKCGSRMKIKSGKGGTYYYFVCKKRDDFGTEACDMEPCSEQKNTPLILRAILDDILSEENLRAVIDTVRDEASPTNEKQRQQLASIEKQIAKLNQQEDRLLEAYLTAMVPVSKLNARSEKIQEQIAEQEMKKAETESQMGDEAIILENPERIIAYAKDVQTYLQQDNIKSVNAVCKRFVKTIWFEPGYATIEYAIPVPDGNPKPAVRTNKVALKHRVRSTVSSGWGAPVRTGGIAQPSGGVV